MSGRTAAGQLTGQLTPLAQKRLSRERQRLEQERKELEEFGIFTQWGDELHKALALVIGPEGTPYEHGFYFFDIEVPDSYPMHPPNVAFRTGDGRVRFNPNLYVEGKVCLSILGTWSGPSWTTSCNLRTVLVSIQSLLNEHPIQNEPGHEKETGKDDKAYSEIIRYENIAVGVVHMLKNTPAKFIGFRPAMRKIFLKNADSYLKTLESYKAKDGTTVRSPIWNFQVRYRAKEVIAELTELREQLQKEESDEAAIAAADSAQSDGTSAAACADAASPAEQCGDKRREHPEELSGTAKQPRT